MNMVNKGIKKHIKTIVAWSEGKTIEFYSDTELRWVVVSSPLWWSGAKYRVAPKIFNEWMNIYDSGAAGVWPSREEADHAFGASTRIACIPITYKKGEGL